jgi:putative DNA primase/helicase
MEYAKKVAAAFLKANPEANVKIVDLPDLPEGGDFVDWHTGLVNDGVGEFTAVATLLTLCCDAEHVTLDQCAPQTAPVGARLAVSVPLPPLVPCGVDVLDNILSKLPVVNWELYEKVKSNGKIEPPSERDYILRTIERVLPTADREGTPFVNHPSGIYYFVGTHHQLANEQVLKNFLIEAAIRCGVPSDVAVYLFFVKKMFDQFLISTARHNNCVPEPDTSFINLLNGTLFFDRTGHRFEAHSAKRFIRYCLDFAYDPNAIAPTWQKHIDRSQPIPEKQQYLAKCMALPFYPGKIEKAVVFYGQRDTGKSTTEDTFMSLLGYENVTSESLSALTRGDSQGDYARARLAGKLVNIASDISAKLNDEGMAKTLISREAVSARNPYGKGFDMRNYARLMFAMNNMPPQFFTDPALTKRVAIIEFDQKIAANEIDTNFVVNMIATERPGILNWIIAGLDQLLKTGRLDPPQCCVERMEQMREEHDPISSWLAINRYYPGNSESVTVKSAYSNFVDHCKDDGHQVPSKKTFTQRLRNLGYEVYALNGHIGVKLFYTTSAPNNDSPKSHDSLPPENSGENRVQAGNDTIPCPPSFPDDSPTIPPSAPTNTGLGNEGNEGNENSGDVLSESGVILCDENYIPYGENNPFPEYGDNTDADLVRERHRRQSSRRRYW